MRSGVFAIGIVMLLLGGFMYLATAREVYKLLGYEVASSEKEIVLQIGDQSIPMKSIGVLLGLMGIILAIGGAISSGKGPQYYPYQPPPPEPVYTCPTCGNPLTYIPRYRRWYCYNCRKYV
ncbi:MAG: transposase [Thaumarchaeota archaeon]|nr:transposase [Nitrososphaerota archaeon]